MAWGLAYTGPRRTRTPRRAIGRRQSDGPASLVPESTDGVNEYVICGHHLTVRTTQYRPSIGIDGFDKVVFAGGFQSGTSPISPVPRFQIGPQWARPGSPAFGIYKRNQGIGFRNGFSFVLSGFQIVPILIGFRMIKGDEFRLRYGFGGGGLGLVQAYIGIFANQPPSFRSVATFSLYSFNDIKRGTADQSSTYIRTTVRGCRYTRSIRFGIRVSIVDS